MCQPVNFIGITNGLHYGLSLDYGWNDKYGGPNMPVISVADGTVISVENQKYAGKVIYIEQEDGTVSYYAHLSNIIVKVGQKVKMAEQIGNMGKTGKDCTGCHLHYGLYSSKEVMYGKSDLNPFDYLEVYEGQVVGNTSNKLYGNKIKYHQDKPVEPTKPKTIAQLWLHKRPNFKTETNIALMNKGCEVEILGEENGMYKVKIEGYASKNYIK